MPNKNHITITIKKETYERLLRRKKEHSASIDAVINRILNGDIDEQEP